MGPHIEHHGITLITQHRLSTRETRETREGRLLLDCCAFDQFEMSPRATNRLLDWTELDWTGLAGARYSGGPVHISCFC